LAKGRQRLFGWESKKGDFSINTTTPSKNVYQKDESDTLEHCLRKYEKGNFDNVTWLNELTFEMIKEKNSITRSKRKNNIYFLHIEFPQFEYPILHYEPTKKVVVTKNTEKKGNKQKLDLDQQEESILVNDPTHPNPVESKFSTLEKSSFVDPTLKPDIDDKNKLEKILSYPPIEELKPEEKQLIWKYQYFLQSNPHGLAKFLRCIDWNEKLQVEDAIKMLKSWSPIEGIKIHIFIFIYFYFLIFIFYIFIFYILFTKKF
jgi:phosphatidylinositol 3-kinase